MALTPPPVSPPTVSASEPASTNHWLDPIRDWSSRVFASQEVDRDVRLKMICGALLLYFHLTFFHWWQQAESLSTGGNEVFNYAPAAIIQNFRWLVFLDRFQTAGYLYALGMLALLGLFSLFWLRSSLLAHGILAWLFVNKVYFYLCDYRLFANYHHFHLLYTLTFLLAPDKLRFFRGALAVSYFMSAFIKLTPSWLFGEYFNSLPDKLPFLPRENWVVTAASVGVVVLEIVGPLCWFTRIAWLRRLSFGAFILFHLYSGVIVGFRYTTLMLPVVMTAFLGFHEPLSAGYRFARRHLALYGLFALALGGGLYHHLIPGDARLTAEGRYFGSFMFDANRSVRFETEIQKGNKLWLIRLERRWSGEDSATTAETAIRCEYYENGWLTNRFAVAGPIRDGEQVIFNPKFFTSAAVRMFGDPYLYYFYARELVRRYQPDRVALRLDQQINGHPEVVRLLDIEDFGALNPTYHPFKHNDWIQLPGPDSPPEYRWP